MAQPVTSNTAIPKKNNNILIWLVFGVGVLFVICCTATSGILAGLSGGGKASTNEPSPLSFLSVSKDNFDCSHDSIGNMIIEGIVKNTSTKYTFRFIQIRGTAYDHNDDVVGTHVTYADSDMMTPGASSAYTIYIDDPRNQATSCGVEIEGARLD